MGSMDYDFNLATLWPYRDHLLSGLRITVVLFLISAAGALIVAVFVGICATSRLRMVRVLAQIYVEVNRNVPAIVLLFFLYFAVGLDAYPAAILGLVLHHGAYQAEVVRAGIQAIPRTQMEAGLASGLSRARVMRKIILPQAFEIIIPPLTTLILNVLKSTSLVMVLSIQDLTFEMQEVDSVTFRGFEAATVSTALYLLMCLVVAGLSHLLSHAIERRRHLPVLPSVTVLSASGV